MSQYARFLSHGTERGGGSGVEERREVGGGEGEGNFLLSTLSGAGTGCHLLTRVISCVSFLSFLHCTAASGQWTSVCLRAFRLQRYMFVFLYKKKDEEKRLNMNRLN